jgi:hypothetical protein
MASAESGLWEMIEKAPFTRLIAAESLSPCPRTKLNRINNVHTPIRAFRIPKYNAASANRQDLNRRVIGLPGSGADICAGSAYFAPIPELLTKAICRLSGDQDGALSVPCPP